MTEYNDPKWTAFALRELPDDEMRDLEILVADDPDLQKEIDAIRDAAEQIKKTFENEPVPAINATPKKRKWYRITLLEGGVCCVVLLMLVALLMPASQSARSKPQYSIGLPKPMWTNQKPIDLPQELEMNVLPDLDIMLFEGKPAPVGVRERTENLERDASDIAGRPALLPPLGLPDPNPSSGIYYQNAIGGVAIDDAGKLSKGKNFAKEMKKADRASVPFEQNSFSMANPEFGNYSVEDARHFGGVKLMVEPKIIVQREEEMSREKSATASVLERTNNLESTERVQAMDQIRDVAGPPGIVPQIGIPTTTIRDGVAITTYSGYESSEKTDENSVIGTSESAALDVRQKYELPQDAYDLENSARFTEFVENAFLKPQDAPFSTFSIDVDTASYSVMRRAIQSGQRPPKDSVRLEEYVNYFKYNYPEPTDGKPFATHVEVAHCPWNPANLLAKIGIKGKEIAREERPALNLVFLVDVSGSMEGSNRLPLVQHGLTELVEMLQDRDRVAIVTYAGESKIALPSISGREKQAILDSITALSAGGSTAGAQGIQTAYEVARKNFTKDGQNRVILCTDGDFNVGVTDNTQLEAMIQSEAKSGVFLTVLGFGMGNFKDDRLKILSSKGNGNYGYIDTIEEARRLLVDNLTGTLITIAKDVKIQVDFNPGKVAAYRLLGYENRKLADRDFHDDTKDAGEIGAGHTITALYEIVPVGGVIPGEDRVDASRYSTEPAPVEGKKTETPSEHADELMFVKLRYKQPEASSSELLTYPVADAPREMSNDFRFASAVALFGMLLRDSQYSGTGNFATVRELATRGADEDKYRKEFVEILEKVISDR